MSDAYEEIRSTFRGRGIELAPIEEIIDDTKGTYYVHHRDKKYCICRDFDDRNSWANATVALFEIVNSQLTDADVRLYAINGGNDLGGIILTEAQCAQARGQLEEKTDWPYLPQHGDEWIGQPH